MGFEELVGNFKHNMALLQLRMQMRADSEGAREVAIREIGNSNETGLIEPVIKALKDKSPGVRRAAAVTLGQFGDARAVDPLIDATRDPNYHVRRAAVSALGLLKSARTVDTLVISLKDADKDVRTMAIDGLIKLGEPSIQPLLHCLDASEEFIRREAIRALGIIKAPEALEPLVHMLKNSQTDAQVAAEALDALNWKPMQPEERVLFSFARGRFDDPIQDGQVSVPALIQTLTDPKTTFRRAAARALGMIGDPRATEPLVRATKDDANEVREAAQRALGQLKDDRTLDVLIAGTKDDNLDVREAAIRALGELKSVRAVEALIACTRHGEHHIRAAAIEALGNVDDPRTVEPLVNALTDKRHNVRKAAAEALVKQGGSIVDALLPSLTGGDVLGRISAAEALGQLGDPSAVPALMNALHDKAEQVRKEAVRALGLIHDPRSLEAVCATLQDENGDVRAVAVHALGEMGAISVVPLLVEAISDRRMALAAIEALQTLISSHATSLNEIDLHTIADLHDLKYEIVEYDALLGNVPVQHDLDCDTLVMLAKNELQRRGR